VRERDERGERDAARGEFEALRTEGRREGRREGRSDGRTERRSDGATDGRRGGGGDISLVPRDELVVVRVAALSAEVIRSPWKEAGLAAGSDGIRADGK
jgi:hypothetical protein